MKPVLYGIPNCDTVRKARAWLDGRGIAYEFHDLRKQGVPPPRLDRWVSELGAARLVNRKGTTWRGLDAAAQAGADSDEGAKALMLAQPSVIKRPVVEWPAAAATVGFDPAAWEALAGPPPG